MNFGKARFSIALYLSLSVLTSCNTTQVTDAPSTSLDKRLYSLNKELDRYKGHQTACVPIHKIMIKYSKIIPEINFAFARSEDSNGRGRECGYAYNSNKRTADKKALSNCQTRENKKSAGKSKEICRLLEL